MTRRSFYPPRPNLPLIWLLQKNAPWISRWLYQLEMVITADPLVDLAALRQQPCIWLCNHPTFDDPLVMFLLSAHLGKPFHFLAAHEQFRGIQGRLFQRIGAYSVRRGAADRDSMVTTAKLMGQPETQLVIFPEGGCSFQNDTVMPFRSGAIQIGLQTLSRQAKQNQPLNNLLVVPVSLKYRYSGNMVRAIERSLGRLEQALHLPTTGDYYQRLRVVAEQVLLHCEADYQLPMAPGANWNQRISALKTEVLNRCEAQLELPPLPQESDRERVYRIYQAMETRRTTLLADGRDGWQVMLRSMSRVLNFDAIYDGYVAEKPTPERFLDTVVRLEREVFQIDQPASKGHRQAFVRVGMPVYLQDYQDAYLQQRSQTVTQLTQQMQQTVQQNLNVLSEAIARGLSW